MGKDKKRKLSDAQSASIGELQRQGDFKIDPEEIPKALDDSSWPYVFFSSSLSCLQFVLRHTLTTTTTTDSCSRTTQSSTPERVITRRLLRVTVL